MGVDGDLLRGCAIIRNTIEHNVWDCRDATCSVKSFCVRNAEASVTWIVKKYFPMELGVPERVPELALSVMPGGSRPLMTTQL